MEPNPLQQALELRLGQDGASSIVTLIDSNFLDNGFVLPAEILRNSFDEWLVQRSYHPDSKGERAARAAIADFYNKGGPVSRSARPPSRHIDPEQVLITASSSESYNLLFQTFCHPGDNILLPQPGYPLFEDLAAACQVETRFYPLSESAGWQPDLDILELLPDNHTRFLVLISPNNPCGSLLSEPLLSRILELCKERNIMVISDEVFSEFLYETQNLPRAGALNTSVPVFTLNGISKLFACPDLKLSWIQVSDPGETGLVDLLAVRNDSFLSCNSFSQFLLPRLFEEASFFVQGMIRKIAKNRAFMKNIAPEIETNGCRIFVPDAGIHGIIILDKRVFGADDESLAIRLVKEFGVYLHPGFLYGIDDKNALVFSILKENDAFQQGVHLLSESLRRIGGQAFN